jgi:hypothetical protein
MCRWEHRLLMGQKWAALCVWMAPTKVPVTPHPRKTQTPGPKRGLAFSTSHGHSHGPQAEEMAQGDQPSVTDPIVTAGTQQLRGGTGITSTQAPGMDGPRHSCAVSSASPASGPSQVPSQVHSPHELRSTPGLLRHQVLTNYKAI